MRKKLPPRNRSWRKLFLLLALLAILVVMRQGTVWFQSARNPHGPGEAALISSGGFTLCPCLLFMLLCRRYMPMVALSYSISFSNTNDRALRKDEKQWANVLVWFNVPFEPFIRLFVSFLTLNICWQNIWYFHVSLLTHDIWSHDILHFICCAGFGYLHVSCFMLVLFRSGSPIISWNANTSMIHEVSSVVRFWKCIIWWPQ